MRQYRAVGRRIVAGFGVIALASACYLILDQWGTLDRIWGDTRLRAKAEICLERGDFDNALNFANRAVQCSPDFWGPYYCRAQVFEARGDFAAALNDYTKVDSLRYYDGLADRFDTFADRGRVYETMGLGDKAAASYCEALRGGRNSNRSRIVRGVAFCRVKKPGVFNDIDRHSDAVSLLLTFIEEAIKREPDNQDLRECRELLRSEGKQ
jgi:tetratricopeptide (TPR) repeat protein